MWQAQRRTGPRGGHGGQTQRRLSVHSRAAGASRGVLCGAGPVLACALGRSGRRAVKREGDGATPTGRFRLIEVRYRADRLLPPRTGLPIRPIKPRDGWCDWPSDRNYNRAVQLPYSASAERMWRDDHLYDIVVILDCNIRPRMRERGSAIFMHLARPGLQPTAGCIALSLRDIRLLLARAGRRSALVVPT